ncbi:MAG: hypothetical protein ACM3TR_17365 [Caulobacteraceae bacterium]
MEKGIYLDIDMDYFVTPVEKISVDNIRIFHDMECETSPVGPVADKLIESGLSWDKNVIHCFTNHKKSYTYWWMCKRKGYTVIHIDAHSDLYRNYNKDLRLLPNGEISCYNYLWYAIRDHYIDEIYWVIPDSQRFLIDDGKAEAIINRALIKNSYKDSKGMHIHFGCICIDGVEKDIVLHACTIEKLPYMKAACDIVTIATSPEFIPAKADSLVYELFECFDASDDVKKNIYRQHLDMLSKPKGEVEEARTRLGIF